MKNTPDTTYRAEKKKAKEEKLKLEEMNIQNDESLSSANTTIDE